MDGASDIGELSERMAKRAIERGLKRAAERFEQTSAEAKQAAETLRAMLLGGQPGALASETVVAQSEATPGIG